MGVPQGSPCQQNLSFACFMLGYSSKNLLELSKVFVEHALHVAIYSFEPRPNSCPCGTMGSVMTISLSISGIIVFDKRRLTSPGSPGGGYSHTLPIWVCAAQRGRDFEAPDLERGIHFRGVF